MGHLYSPNLDYYELDEIEFWPLILKNLQFKGPFSQKFPTTPPKSNHPTVSYNRTNNSIRLFMVDFLLISSVKQQKQQQLDNRIIFTIFCLFDSPKDT
jgi:hypothetical protein